MRKTLCSDKKLAQPKAILFGSRSQRAWLKYEQKIGGQYLAPAQSKD
jgi:hypothetical protein